MISWIQKYFQHHFRIIFALILISTIISFIIAFGPGSNLGRGDGRKTVTREFFGYNLGSQEDQSRLIGDAGLSVNLQSGYNSLEGADLQNYAFQRVAALALADQLHVPASSKQEIAEYIKGLRIFAGEDGQFDAKRYATFRDGLKTNPRLSEALVSRVLADDVRADKVQKIIAGPGYVLPHDVQTQLDRADSLWTVATATVDYASFAPYIPLKGSDQYARKNRDYLTARTTRLGVEEHPLDAVAGVWAALQEQHERKEQRSAFLYAPRSQHRHRRDDRHRSHD